MSSPSSAGGERKVEGKSPETVDSLRPAGVLLLLGLLFLA